MASTIIDVAKASGFSKATVSRAFLSPAMVKPKTKSKIYEAAKALHYTPDAIARAMVRKKTDNIAFVIYEQQYPVVLNPYYACVFEGILEEVTKKGYSIFISSDKELRLPTGDMYIKKHMDGLILCGKTDITTLNSLRKQNVPIVLLNNYLDCEGVTCIVSDEYKGASLAVEHLVSLGHKKIAAVLGNFLPFIYNARYDAYIDTLKAHNIDVNEDYVFTIEATREKAYDCVKGILNSDDCPTAIYCTNDTIAIGALKAIRDCGKKVPEDIAVIGYDDTDACTICEPELSSVHVEKEEMGRIAALELLQQIDGGDRKKKCIVTNTQLVIRDSTQKGILKK